MDGIRDIPLGIATPAGNDLRVQPRLGSSAIDFSEHLLR